MSSDDLSLLLPEWQGYGRDSGVAAGARAIAGLFPAGAFVEIPAPSREALPVEGGVIGLSSIAACAERTLAAIREHRPARIFTVGGTCGADLAPVAWLNDRYRGDLAVVWLDAHGDLNTPETSPSSRFHGMVLRTLLGAGPELLVRQLPRRLEPPQIVLAGTRDLDRDESAFISDAAISMLGPADLLVPDRVVGRIRAAGHKRVYVHLDLDVLDPAEFPDALVRVPGGVSIKDIAETVHGLATGLTVVGFSVVEFNPRPASDGLSKIRDLLARTGVDIGAMAQLAGA